MIRFCDKEVYTIHCGDMTRTQMLMFFLNTDRMGVIVIYDENDDYYGVTNYFRVIKNVEEKDYIVKDYFVADDSFWDVAGEYFEMNPKELIPVFDKSGTMLGFCYNDDRENFALRTVIENLEKAENIPVLLHDYYKEIKQIFITDCNEWVYRLYCIFKRLKYPVCVLGEKWEWFGIPQMEGYYDYPEYAKFYIYAEGTGNYREQTREKRLFASDIYPPVNNAFVFLSIWGGENVKMVYRQKIAKLINQKISVCRVLMPGHADVKFFTDIEMAGFYLDADPSDGGITNDTHNELREKITIALSGKQAYEWAKEGMLSDLRGYKKVTYNEVWTEMMEDIHFQKRIYAIGHCSVLPLLCNHYRESLTSRLQEIIVDNGEEYAVVRVYIPFGAFDTFHRELERLPIRKGDIVLFIDEKPRLLDDTSMCPTIDLTDCYNDSARKTWMFGKNPLHINATGRKVIAEAIYDRFLKDEMARLNREVTEHFYVQKGEVLSEELQHDVFEYVKNVKNWNKGGVTGCIVMNCNPFTLGHQYLIEYAAKQVDKLYLFVVEENRSFFTFEERFEMVRKGTEHLANVHVVPSGEWVLSFKTLPVYFEKAKMQEEKVDAQMDLEIFARYIAPALGIKKRFVGEEPTDKVTRQYNEQMKRILNEFDIEVEEIPRKEMNGRPISASYVRKCIEEECYEELMEYIPESTYTVLRLNG